MKKTLFTCLLLISVATSIAQDYFPTNSGLKQENNNYTAFTNATLYISPNKVIKKGTLLIQNGKVVESGNHTELMAIDGGVYRNLSELQFA